MNTKKFSDALNQIDNKYIDEALNYKKYKTYKKFNWLKLGAMAACFVAVSFSIHLAWADTSKKQFVLSDNSYNVTVKYTNIVPSDNITINSMLAYYTEEELFSNFDTHIFKGKILSLDNIVMDFNGYKMYRAIAQIEIEKVYRGSCDKGDIVSVMLPCPINKNFWVEDTDTVCAMKEGMTGIFMPTAYNEQNSILKYNNAVLVKKDIADYGFPDGSRYAFLETEDGLIFDRYSYETISDAKTLDEVEEYVENMIIKVSSINYEK